MGNTGAKPLPKHAWALWQYRLPGGNDADWVDFDVETSEELEEALKNSGSEQIYTLRSSALFTGDQFLVDGDLATRLGGPFVLRNKSTGALSHLRRIAITYLPSSLASLKPASTPQAGEARRLSATRVRAIESALAAMVRGVLPDPAPGSTAEAPGFEQVHGGGAGSHKFRLVLPRVCASPVSTSAVPSSSSGSASSSPSSVAAAASASAAAGATAGAALLEGHELVIEVEHSSDDGNDGSSSSGAGVEGDDDVASELARPMLTYQQAVTASIAAAKRRTGEVSRAAKSLRLVSVSSSSASSSDGEALVRVCEVLDDTEGRQKATKEAAKKKK